MQWDLDPSELDASVTARVPVRTSRDDRYFTDTFQAMPLHGYTRMFEKILDHPNIKVMLTTDYAEIKDEVTFRELIFTGPVDEYFDYCYGKLPYRSLHFEHQTHDKAHYQEAAVVNYPNEHAYTRITEFKYLTGQEHSKTSIVFEYPQSEGVLTTLSRSRRTRSSMVSTRPSQRRYPTYTLRAGLALTSITTWIRL